MSDEIFDDNIKNELPQSVFDPKEDRFKFFKNKKVIVSVLGFLLLISFLVWLALGKDGKPEVPVSNNVLLYIKGPASIASGNEGDYRMTYTNGEDADLTDVTLEVFYPSNFKFKSSTPAASSSTGQRFNLPILKKGEEGKIKIKGKVSGSTGEIKEFRAKLTYKLSNFNSEFSVENKMASTILAPDLNLDIVGPIDVVLGQDTTFTITYTNVSGQTFENLALVAAFPDGYKFASSLPAVSKNNNYWTIPKLDIGASGKVEITGSFASNNLVDQLVSAELGLIVGNTFAPLVNSSTVFKSVPSSLSLTLSSSSQDTVKLDEIIQVQLSYANNGSIGLSNIVIIVLLEGTAFDLTKLSVSDAIVSRNTITWKSATLSNLSLVFPNQKGKIQFSVPVRSNLTANIKNQTLKISATIYSTEIPKPIRVPDVELKLASQLGLLVNGEYISGSLPMKVGEQTTFALTFLLTNLSNDLENTEVISSMPLPASAWTNVIIPDSEKTKVTYDSTSGKIGWKIGNLPAFIGKFSPALKVSFHLTVTPTEADKGKVIDLLRDVQAFGYDEFANMQLASTKVSDLDTGTIDDDLVNAKGNTVQ